jgi:hypothetical protein
MDTLRPTNLTTRPSLLAGGALIGALLYSWVAASFRPFTLAENLAVALPVVAVLVGVARSWHGSQSRAKTDPGQARPRRIAGAVWISLVTLLVAWELIAYVSSPRDDHPTLSSIADEIMSAHPGRALMFALWLALGWGLFLRRMRPRPALPPEVDQ